MRATLPHYSMVIEWSDADLAFLVTLPEWAERVVQPVTHGSTYAEAVKHGQEVLAMLIEDTLQAGESLPLPHLHTAA